MFRQEDVPRQEGSLCLCLYDDLPAAAAFLRRRLDAARPAVLVHLPHPDGAVPGALVVAADADVAKRVLAAIHARGRPRPTTVFIHEGHRFLGFDKACHALLRAGHRVVATARAFDDAGAPYHAVARALPAELHFAFHSHERSRGRGAIRADTARARRAWNAAAAAK